MKKIKLTKGFEAIVDDEDFEYLSQWKWHISTNGYAMRKEHIHIAKNKYGHKIFRMHRVINNTPDDLFTDHINRDKLDNRRVNLRTVNKSQNGLNVGVGSANTSGYKGVYWDKFNNKWRAEIKVLGKKKCLGRYADISGAWLARRLGERLYAKI
jgi:hypothetical protein